MPGKSKNGLFFPKENTFGASVREKGQAFRKKNTIEQKKGKALNFSNPESFNKVCSNRNSGKIVYLPEI